MGDIDDFIKRAYEAIDAAEAHDKATAPLSTTEAAIDAALADDSPFQIGVVVLFSDFTYNDNNHSVIWTDVETAVNYVNDDGTFFIYYSEFLFTPRRPISLFSSHSPDWTAGCDEMTGTISLFRQLSDDEIQKRDENRKEIEQHLIELIKLAHLMKRGKTVEVETIITTIDDGFGSLRDSRSS